MKQELSKREQEILNEVSKLKQEKEIAEALHISPLTVNTHISNIKRKIKDMDNITINTKEELIAFFICKSKGILFNLKKIREKGITTILVLVNLCSINN